tara:strand:- start:429 stop:902 length:474 start_codon:yes stop_codon:yes gene_type:complete
MNIKKIIIVISLFFLLSCGYEPIYSKKKLENKYNFSISSITFSGVNDINQILKNDLINFTNIDSKETMYDLNINSSKIITITSKNKKGNPEVFNMKILINLEILKNKKIINKRNFDHSFEYKNKSSKFQLKQYEQNIRKNIVSKLSQDIVDHLYSIK